MVYNVDSQLTVPKEPELVVDVVAVVAIIVVDCEELDAVTSLVVLASSASLSAESGADSPAENSVEWADTSEAEPMSRRRLPRILRCRCLRPSTSRS